MAYHFLILAFFLLPLSAFAGGNGKEEDDPEIEQLSILKLTLPPLSLGTVAKKPPISEEDMIDLSDFTILEPGEKEEKSPNKIHQKEVRVKDAPWEHHLDPDKDIGDLRHLNYWYIENNTPLRLWILLLKNGHATHPLAGLMTNEILAYRRSSILNQAIKRNDSKEFFKQALLKLSLSFLHLKQRIALTRPSEDEIKDLKIAQGKLEEKLNKVSKKIELKALALDLMEGRTLNRGRALGELTGASKENAENIKIIIRNLEIKKGKIAEELQKLEEKKKSIQELFSLSADQEDELSVTQKQEFLFIMNPDKLTAYMNEKFVELQKKVAELQAKESKEDQKELAESLHSLAHCYFWGWGCSQSFTTALEYFSKAASAGNPRAYEDKGHMLAGGFGIDKSSESAFEAYRQSSLNDSNGHLLLAHCHHAGCGVKESQKQTLEHLKIAAEKKNPIALRALIQLDKSTMPIREDQIEFYGDSIDKKSAQEEHTRLLKRISEGDQDAYHSLGKYFLWGAQNYYYAALCFSIGYLSIDSESTYALYPIFFPEIKGEQQSDQDPCVIKKKVNERFKEFLKKMSQLIINQSATYPKEIFETFENIVKVRREVVKQTLNFDSVGFAEMYQCACRGIKEADGTYRGIKECRRLLGYYYFFGWRERNLKKAALFFASVDSPLPEKLWESMVAEFFSDRVEGKKYIKDKQSSLNESTDNGSVCYLSSSIKWSWQLGNLGYSTGDYRFGKLIKHIAPRLSFKYFSRQAGQHPKATSELGKLYFTGRGTPDRKTDPIKAFQEWSMAGLKGCREATFYAGACLEKGWGTRGTKEVDRLREVDPLKEVDRLKEVNRLREVIRLREVNRLRDAKELLLKAKEEGYVISSKTLPEFRDIKLIIFPKKYDNQ